MKAWKIFTGLGLLLAAALLILDALGMIAPLVSFIGEITAIEIICGLLIIALIINRLIRGRIPSIFFLLAFLFMLFEENIAYICHLENENIINNWLVLLIALLLSSGFTILFPFSGRKKRRKCKLRHNINVEYSGNYAETNLGASSVYIDCITFSPSHIENNLGACSIHFENVEKYEGGKTLYVENNLGSMCINVPSGWIVKSSVENNLGGTSIQHDENSNECGPILYIKGESNLGALSIRFV